jgi:hypothetical protein
LCLTAGVSAPHYGRLKRAHGTGVTARLLIALLRGLKSVRAGFSDKRPKDLAMMNAAYAGCLSAAAAATGVEPEVVTLQLRRQGEYPGDAAWRAASKARAVALYLASTEVGISGAMLASLARLSPAAVSYALNRVEELRENESFDAALDKAAQQLGTT